MLDTCYNYYYKEGEEGYKLLIEEEELQEYHGDWYYSYKEERNYNGY